MPHNDDSKIAHEIIKRFETLRSERANFDDHWRDVAERVAPLYKDEFQSTPTNRTRGDRKNDFIFDSTAAIANGRFASIMDSLLTPRNAKWHKLRVSNAELQKDRTVKLWFDEVTELFFKFRYTPKANFAAQNNRVFELVGAFGNGPMFIDELQDEPGIRYKACNLAGIYFTENHQGLIDSVYRLFKLTVRQAAQKWPDTLPERMKKQMGKNSQTEFEFIHCVKPNDDQVEGARDFTGMPFSSAYVAIEGNALLEEGGYRSFPYAISRHKQAPGTPYAYSPAMEVLPAIKTLNEQKKSILKQGHRAVDPVLLAHDDGVLSRFSLRPGALNMGGVTKDGRPLVHTLPVGNVPMAKELMEDERNDIKDVFLVTLFQILVDSPTMTATEVLERVKEKGILLAPTFSRQETEYLGPLIEREFDLLLNQGLLPPIPDLLLEAEGEYTIEYDSPFSKSQRAQEASGLMRVYEWAISVATGTQNPAILDHFNEDLIVPDIAHIHGLPEKWMRGQEEIAQIRSARADAQLQEQAAQAAPGAAAMVNAAANAKEKAPEEFAEVAGEVAG